LFCTLSVRFLGMKIELVVFDLAGTTVDDNIDGLPLVTVALQDAFRKSGFVLEPMNVNAVRGMEKREAISALLENFSETRDPSLVDKIFSEFRASLDQNLSKLSCEIPGTTDIFRELRRQKIRIAVGSGFPHRVVENIVKLLKWTNVVDFISSAEKEGHGRPHPCLIESAMKEYNISNARQVVKVGDTKLDILEGKNAGCWTVAVLTGTQEKETLIEENPDFVIDSVADMSEVIQKIQCFH